jgi:hypothetical protein
VLLFARGGDLRAREVLSARVRPAGPYRLVA